MADLLEVAQEGFQAGTKTAGEAIQKARLEAQDIPTTVATPLRDTPTFKQATTATEGGSIALGETPADPVAGGSPQSKALLEYEPDKQRFYGEGHDLPGTYTLPDETEVSGAKIVKAGVTGPGGQVGYHVQFPSGESAFIAYEGLGVHPETLEQRSLRLRAEGESEAVRRTQEKGAKADLDWAQGVMQSDPDWGEYDKEDREEAAQLLVGDAEYYARNHGKHKHVEGDDIYKAGAIDRDVAIDNAVGVDLVQLGPRVLLEIYHHSDGGTEPYLIQPELSTTEVHEFVERVLAMEGLGWYHDPGIDPGPSPDWMD